MTRISGDELVEQID